MRVLPCLFTYCTGRKRLHGMKSTVQGLLYSIYSNPDFNPSLAKELVKHPQNVVLCLTNGQYERDIFRNLCENRDQYISYPESHGLKVLVPPNVDPFICLPNKLSKSYFVCAQKPSK